MNYKSQMLPIKNFNCDCNRFIYIDISSLCLGWSWCVFMKSFTLPKKSLRQKCISSWHKKVDAKSDVPDRRICEYRMSRLPHESQRNCNSKNKQNAKKRKEKKKEKTKQKKWSKFFHIRLFYIPHIVDLFGGVGNSVGRVINT